MACPPRILTVVAFFGVGIIFAPNLLGSQTESPSASSVVSASKLAHLLCFSTTFGAALWVTFIGGIIMFKNLSRHMFGNLQSRMFPAYFTLVSVCAVVSVTSFAYLNPWRTGAPVERYQLGFLLSALGFDLSNLLVFTPMIVEVLDPITKRISIKGTVTLSSSFSRGIRRTVKNPYLRAKMVEVLN